VIPINIPNILLWTFRRNEKDVIDLYDSLCPLMQLTTGGLMLNFGYWDNNTRCPLHAQHNLSRIVADFSSLQSAKSLVDVGSGFSVPAIQWKSKYHSLDIACVNLNLYQLKTADCAIKSSKYEIENYEIESISILVDFKKISLLNATSTFLPFKDNSVDRVIAFESAQHFKPLIHFIRESKRILESNGLLVVVMPVINNTSKFSLIRYKRLGILSLSWASEHYKLDEVKSMMVTEDFRIKDIRHIGSNVYEPLANYYIKHRERLRSLIVKEYPTFIETILFRSLVKMRNLSQNSIIDYVLISALRM